MNDRVAIDIDAAIAALPDGEDVHTYIDPQIAVHPVVPKPEAPHA